jgi:hypothetical protein
MVYSTLEELPDECSEGQKVNCLCPPYHFTDDRQQLVTADLRDVPVPTPTRRNAFGLTRERVHACVLW